MEESKVMGAAVTNFTVNLMNNIRFSIFKEWKNNYLFFKSYRKSTKTLLVQQYNNPNITVRVGLTMKLHPKKKNPLVFCQTNNNV